MDLLSLWNTRISRRALLRAAGLWGCSLALPTGAKAVENERSPGGLFAVEKQGALMGTFVRLKALCPSRLQGQQAIGEAFEEMARLSILLDWRRSYSPVGVLNENGRLDHMPPELRDNLELARHYFQCSGGAFDITVLPLFQLMRRSFEDNGQPPSDNQIKETLSLVGMRHMKQDRKGVHFRRAGMMISLDGVAKGYIVDRGIEVMRKSGIKDCLIAAGGDIRVHSSPGSGRHWRIGVRDPWNEGEYLTILHLDNGGVATSGCYEIYFDRQKHYHHLLDPLSGLPAVENMSVTVRSATAADADALATALFLLDRNDALSLAESLPDTHCLIVDREQRRFESEAWMTKPLQDERT